MSTAIDRQPGESPLLLQDGSEAVQGVQNVVDRRWGETVVVGRIEPRLDIVQGGRREVSLALRLACPSYREILRHRLPAGPPQEGVCSGYV